MKNIGEVLTKARKTTLVKKAQKGKDMGAPGKNFDKIAASSGGGDKGKRIAGAMFWRKAKQGTL